MSKAAALYLMELDHLIRQASRYLNQNSDPTLEAEIESGKAYLARFN